MELTQLNPVPHHGRRYLQMGYFEYNALYTKVESSLNNVIFHGIKKWYAFDETIRYLQTGNATVNIPDYVIGEEKLREVVKNVIKVLSDLARVELEPNMVKWKKIQADNLEMYRFPNCVGALGVTKLKLLQREKIFKCLSKKSIRLYGVTDPQSRFVLLEVLPRSKKYFRDTDIYFKLMADELDLPEPKQLPFSLFIGAPIFAAGKNFPQTFNICTSEKGIRSHDNILYSEKIEKMRVNADRAFHTLKKTFNILKELNDFSAEDAENIIFATVYLHNYIVTSCRSVQVSNFKDNSKMRAVKLGGSLNKEGAALTKDIYQKYLQQAMGRVHYLDTQEYIYEHL